MITFYFWTFIRFFVANIKILELSGHEHSETSEKFYNGIEIVNQIDYVRGTVAINNKWTPQQVEDLELQHENYRGLFFWYNQILIDIADSNKKSKKK